MVRSVLVKKTTAGTFSVKVAAKGSMALVPPNPAQRVQGFLALGGSDFYCASFGGVSGGIFQADTSTLFKVKNPLSEGSCP